ncbi:zf-HC2 domain-containing protein [Actinoplanes sp. NBRC 103695]|uniref:anti-sigma factor family protein n=1 Tax=Actinoplanes sp. NBRC 103695 TaxID=3032202 RepID=UPI0024A5CBAC|nr:zf-HC2 domain-containing protein [Actinoplanes sp. NBRC 103695]GLY98237.1 anti-sigma factor [Actinoplanes sp. NBRC 103695]
MRCDHEHDDGAYVLGALSPAERAAYERHLATCSFCREAVADIAVLPGLLGRLDPEDFAKLLDPSLTMPAPPPPSRSTHLVSAAQRTRRKERKKGRVRVLSTALAAAVLALIVGVGAMFLMSGTTTPTPPGQTVAMHAMSQVADGIALTADVGVTDAPGGSKIDLKCVYNKNSPDLKPYTVKLVAHGADDEEDQLGSWTASPGKEFTMSGNTFIGDGSLSRLELVRGDGKVLLAYDVP